MLRDGDPTREIDNDDYLAIGRFRQSRLKDGSEAFEKRNSRFVMRPRYARKRSAFRHPRFEKRIHDARWNQEMTQFYPKTSGLGQLPNLAQAILFDLA